MKTLLLALLLMASAQTAQDIDVGGLAAHPRLFLAAGEEKTVRKNLGSKSARYLKEAYFQGIGIADKVIDEPVCSWPGEGHILKTSREVLRRVFNLSFAYRMTGWYGYAKRAEEEMLNACMFPHWDPGHYLDTAEMMLAMSVGYDWLYDFLSEDSREMIAESILNKGLRTAEKSKIYALTNNWNSVCNAALVAGSLAIAERIPSEAASLIRKSVQSNPLVLAGYAPDGAYPEGYGYWGYGTGYEVMLISLLEENFGTSFGLADYPGFTDSGRWVPFMQTPTGHSFGFSDSTPDANCNPMLFWFSRRLDDNSIIYLDKKRLEKGDVNFSIEDRFLPLMLIWASSQDNGNIRAPEVNVWKSAGEVPMYIYRSGWDDVNDTYLAVKGGRPNYSHGHMDNGEFYFEKGGVIWAADLGGQSYGTFYKNGVNCWDFSQDGDRWGIWRNCNQMHNTLTVNDGRHLADGHADITGWHEENGRHGCRVDLGNTLSLQLASAVRDVILEAGDNSLVIRDSLCAKEGLDANVYWNLTTKAVPEITGPGRALLKKGDRSVEMTVEPSDSVEMLALSAKSPYSWDVANPGVYRIGFRTVIPAGTVGVLNVKLTYVNAE